MAGWQYTRLPIAAGSRSQYNKVSRAPCEVVSGPKPPPAVLGSYPVPGLKDRLTRPIDTAINAQAAAALDELASQWGQRYPAT